MRGLREITVDYEKARGYSDAFIHARRGPPPVIMPEITQLAYDQGYLAGLLARAASNGVNL